MRIFLSSLSLWFMATASLWANSISPQQLSSAYEHLYEVNKEWRQHPKACDAGFINFQNDRERIAYHLTLVEQYLRDQIPDDLTEAAKLQRNRLLDSLKNYAETKTFPQNIYHQERRPYFIDYRGVHCAVGYLMKASGHGALARKIQKEYNYEYLCDIKTEGVAEWAKKHGFELQELAWIQPAYSPNYYYCNIQEGTNGEVLAFASDPSRNRLYFAGDFTQVDTMSCANVGYYQNGELYCLPAIAGRVNDATYNPNFGFVVAGDFQDAGNHYPLAYYDTIWHYMSISNRPDAVGYKIANWGINSEGIQVVIEDPSTTANQEVWEKTNATNWAIKLEVYGLIEAFAFGMNRTYGGVFDSMYVHRSAYGYTDTMLNTAGHIVKEGYSSSLISSIAAADTVSSLLYLGNDLYFGIRTNYNLLGACVYKLPFASLTPTPLIYNVYLQGSTNISINSLVYFNDLLYIGGNQYTSNGGIVSFARSLISYDIITQEMTFLSYFDDAINDMAVFDNELFLGGAFTSNNRDNIIEPVKHLAKYCGSIPLFTTLNEEICEGDDYISPTGKVFNTAGVYYDTLINYGYAWQQSNFWEIHLTVIPNSRDSIQIDECAGFYISPSETKLWVSSGIYQDTIVNNAGCDSILTIFLNLNGPNFSTIVLTEDCSYTSPSGLHTWTNSGVYYDTLTNQAACDSILQINLTINQADTTVNQIGNSLVVNENDTYQWMDCATMQAIDGATEQLFTPSQSGTYAVEVTSGNCTNTSACYDMILTAVETLEQEQVRIYPNPAQNHISIDFPTIAQGEFVIYNAVGRVVWKGNCQAHQLLNLEAWSKGLYLLVYKGQTWKFNVY